MAQIPGPACLIDVRIDVLAIKWLADPIGACSSSSILAVMLAACPPLCPSLSARVRGCMRDLGLQVEFGRWRQVAGLLQFSSRQIGQCQKSGAQHYPFLKTAASGPTPAGRIYTNKRACSLRATKASLRACLDLPGTA